MDYAKLKRTKVDEVRDAIAAIDYEHKVGSSAMIGRFTDEETKREYINLLKTLPEIPGLTPKEIEMLTAEINKKISRVGVYVHPDYNDDVLVIEEDFMEAIEKVHYEHRYSAGAMFGPLTADEATKDYNTILDVLMKSDIPVERKEALRKQIVTKISQIPKVEAEKDEQRKAYDKKLEKAFSAAKERFDQLSVFKRVKLRLEGKAPEQIDRTFMEVNDLNRLYRK